jgi:Histidine kinase-, DNA gyrase B-, and HSP90-like ATPase
MADQRSLFLDFHGRFIDALGIQMYQKPTAALAELIANAWDADASSVSITLPSSLDRGTEIVIADNGIGMTFQQCQDHYLKVGRNRRQAGAGASPSGRPVLGRKGIGKFAGFGIARKILVDSTSGETGERTVFSLDLEQLRSDEFIDGRHAIEVVEFNGPDEARRAHRGTIVRLKDLTLARVQNPQGFAERMARRFMLAANAQSFQVTVNSISVSNLDPATDVEFDFPTNYRPEERPEGLRTEGAEAVEVLGGQEIRWRVRFRNDTIGDPEFQGVSVFCGIKVAQTPFFFDLSGGLSGQHGQQYLFGYVRADYLDHLTDDLITTERQRINWENPDAARLLDWGQKRIKQLLSIWTARRGEERQRQIDAKVLPFAPRLDRLQTGEKRTVTSAIRRIAAVPTLSSREFSDLATAILTAWEQGRLRDLIDRIATLSDADAGVIISVMGEAQILTVLQLAEVLKTKLDLVRNLRRRVEARELENAIRDYIAKHPWLIKPELELYKKEISLARLLHEISEEIGLEANPDFAKRIDLLLANGEHLVLLEFMRPGITLDRDHLDRFTRYVDELRARIEANTGGPYRKVTGTIVADRLDRTRPGNRQALDRLEQSGMYALDWQTLLAQAERQFRDYFEVMVDRTPDDPRVIALETENQSELQAVSIEPINVEGDE